MSASESPKPFSGCDTCDQTTRQSLTALGYRGESLPHGAGVIVAIVGALVGTLVGLSSRIAGHGALLFLSGAIGGLTFSGFYHWLARRVNAKLLVRQHGTIVIVSDQNGSSWHLHPERPVYTFPQGLTNQMLIGTRYREIVPVWIEFTRIVGRTQAQFRSTPQYSGLIDSWTVRIDDPFNGPAFITDRNGWTRPIEYGNTRGLFEVFELILKDRSFCDLQEDLWKQLSRTIAERESEMNGIARHLGGLVAYLESTKGVARGPTMNELRRVVDHLVTSTVGRTPQYKGIMERGDDIRHLVQLRTELGLKYGLGPSMTREADEFEQCR